MTAPQIQTKKVSEVRNVAVSFSGKLDDGELLTGTPVVTDANSPSPAELTFSNEAVNTSAKTINGISVPIGEAVQFKVAGGTAGKTYNINIVVTTDATPAQTLYGKVRLRVLAD